MPVLFEERGHKTSEPMIVRYMCIRIDPVGLSLFLPVSGSRLALIPACVCFAGSDGHAWPGYNGLEIAWPKAVSWLRRDKYHGPGPPADHLKLSGLFLFFSSLLLPHVLILWVLPAKFRTTVHLGSFKNDYNMADEVQTAEKAEVAEVAHVPSNVDEKDNDASSINEAARGDK